MLEEPPAKRRKVEKDFALELLKLSLPAYSSERLENFLSEKESEYDLGTMYYCLANCEGWDLLASDIKQSVLVCVLSAFERLGMDFNVELGEGTDIMSFHKACTRHPSVARAMLKLKTVRPDHTFDPYTTWSDVTPLDFAITPSRYTSDTFTLMNELIDASSEHTRSRTTEFDFNKTTPLLELARQILKRSDHEDEYERVFDYLLSKAELDGSGLDLQPTVGVLFDQESRVAIRQREMGHIITRHGLVYAYRNGLESTLGLALSNTLPVRDLVSLIVSYILKP